MPPQSRDRSVPAREVAAAEPTDRTGGYSTHAARARARKRSLTLWCLAGAGTGSSALALASIGMFTLLPSLALTTFLLVRRISGSAMFLVGSGVTTAGLWSAHVATGDTPDDGALPIVLAIVLTSLGAFLLFRRRGDVVPP